MYAIFEAKGKQWRADAGATIRMPSMDAEPGDRVTFDEVLLAAADGDIRIGRPLLNGASVSAEVLRHGKGDKIIVFKMKRRKGYRRKQGHRQQFTEVRILEIDPGDGAPAVTEEEARPEEAEAVEEVAAPAEAEAAEPVEEEAEEPEAAEAAGAPEDEAPEEIDATDSAAELAEEYGVDLAAVEGTGKEGRVLKADVDAVIPPEAKVDITDAAAELAAEHDLDITKIEGTGQDGRVLKGDVEAAIEAEAEE